MMDAGHSRHPDRRPGERDARLAGVLMALLRRQTTGRGDFIDVSMHEA